MQQRVKSSSERRLLPLLIGVVTVVALGVVVSGCASDSQAAKGAAEGAGTGALAGAVGGIVGALVFGGDVVDAGARGAVYGGTTGAVVGGMSGSKRDKAQAEQQASQQDKELEKFRKEIGDDAFNGVVALAECKYEVAGANAKVAQTSGNKNYALAGLWVEVLSAADQRQENEARAQFPEIIAQDKDIKTDADAEAAMRSALQEIMNAREDAGLPRVCSA
jgi:hypothetical protein